MPARERADLFAETAERKVLPEAIIEKDFWVCWVLKQIFSIDALSGRLLFKGGTSLSKIFHAISRFSEDIDLAVDYEALGFRGERDPRREDISKTKRAGILDEMMAECRRYIGGEFLDVLKARCAKFSEPRTHGVSTLVGTRTWYGFVTQRQSLRISITFLPRSYLSWERTRNLCHMIVLRSAHSRQKSFRE
jgi:hypothetical protein